jgi:UDP-N-acetylmuramate--alanine ligase
MITHLLNLGGLPVTSLIGGISKNYLNNFITSGKDDILLVEADEYDRSFLHIHPDIAVISAIDPDHLDIYGTMAEVRRSFQDFAGNIRPGGKLVIRSGLKIRPNKDTHLIDYATDERADVFATNLRFDNGLQVFDLLSCEKPLAGVKLQVPGRHNVENTLASIAVCKALGLGKKDILAGISSYTGVKRRFDIIVQRPGRIFIDDYAHHPRELEAFITAVRNMYPGKKLTGLFQPHLYSRTRDFATEFAKSLDLLDETWILDIYPARELPIEGVKAEMILDRMSLKNKKMVGRNELTELLKRSTPEVFLTMGAGDIDLLVEPIKEVLQ